MMYCLPEKVREIIGSAPGSKERGGIVDASNIQGIRGFCVACGVFNDEAWVVGSTGGWRRKLDRGLGLMLLQPEWSLPFHFSYFLDLGSLVDDGWWGDA